MAKNAILSQHTMTDDDERLLDDGVFPYLFGKIQGNTDVPPAEFDLAGNVKALKYKSAEIIGTQGQLCKDMAAWYQAIGTPCGFYMYQALRAQSKLLQSCCLRIATHFPEFQTEVPIYPWLRANIKNWSEMVKSGAPEAAPYEVLIKSLRTWLNLDKAVGVISGESDINFRNARNTMTLLDKWLGGTADLALSLPQGGDPDDEACPDAAGLPLGTNALAASAAQAAFHLFVYRQDMAAQAGGAAFDATPHYRGSAFELYALALFDKQLVARKADSESKLLTYLAASDLAMFTPLHPLFESLRANMRWDDLHPGYRLKKILEVVEGEKLTLETTKASDYYKFTSTICEYLSWPEVPRFLDVVRDSEALLPDDPVHMFFKDACAARELHPAAFFDPMEAAKYLAEIAPAGSQLADFETSRDTDRALAFAVEAELYALGFKLCYYAEQPGFSCPDFADTIEMLHDAPEALKTYFGLQF